MSAIRSSLVFAWMVISIIPLGMGLIIGSLFLSSSRVWFWFAVPWLRGVVVAARWIGGVDYRVTGMHNLPTAHSGQRVILVSKHQSTWETFFFPSMMPQPLAYVFKKELLRIPLFGWSLGRLEMVHIDRSKRKQAWNKVAELGRELMDRGKWIIMFPEGTRSERGKKGSYQTGASRLAVATGAVMVPIAVSSARCWPRRSFWFIPGRIDVSIGPPIEPGERSADELMRTVESWIETEMRVIDPDAYSPDDPLHGSLHKTHDPAGD
ncbi:MAG: lysophospholipid acyltransferase family protein [Congregibacter sp.]